MTRDHRGPALALGLVFIAICLLIGADALVPGFADRVSSLHRWQDLAGAAIALLAALYGANYLLSQIRQADRIEAERNRRAAAAARAVLPLSLNDISEYARAIITAVTPLLGRAGRIRMPRGGLSDLPALPTEVVRDLQAFILTAPDEPGEQVAQIISELQVLATNADSVWRNLRTPRGDAVMADTIQVIVARAALIDARVSVLFPYARREANDTPRVRPADVARALNISGLYPEVFTEVAGFAERLTGRAPLTSPDEPA